MEFLYHFIMSVCDEITEPQKQNCGDREAPVPFNLLCKTKNKAYRSLDILRRRDSVPKTS